MGKATNRDSHTTRAAIIDAAGMLFADRGFSGVTAREVAAQAQVALSAIPYHFGSMKALYREALLVACQISPDAAPLAAQALMAEPQQALRTAVRWAIADASAAASTWQIRLLFREELDPSPEFTEVVSLRVVPEWNWLCEVISRATGRPSTSPEVKFGVIAMYSLTSSFYLQRAMLDHLAPDVAAVIVAKREQYVECMADLTLSAVETFQHQVLKRHDDSRRPRSNATGVAAKTRSAKAERASPRRKGRRT